MTNKLKTRAAKLLLLIFSITLTFCGGDDEGGTNKFTYKIDGESQDVITVTGVLQSEIQYDHEGRTLLLTAAAGLDKMISVTISNWDFQNPPEEGVLEGDYDVTWDMEDTEENPLADCLQLTGDHEEVTLCDGGLVTLISGTDLYFSVFDGNTEGSITITNCNADKHTVSGNFSAKVGSLDGLQQFTVTGSFSNVKYSVQ